MTHSYYSHLVQLYNYYSKLEKESRENNDFVSAFKYKSKAKNIQKRALANFNQKII